MKISNLVNNIIKIVKNAIQDYSNNPDIYFFEIGIFKDAFYKIGRSHLSTLSEIEYYNILMGNDEKMLNYHKIRRILFFWRDLKSEYLECPSQLILPNLSARELSKLNSEEIANKPIIKGLDEEFWSNYLEEILVFINLDLIPRKLSKEKEKSKLVKEII